MNYSKFALTASNPSNRVYINSIICYDSYKIFICTSSVILINTIFDDWSYLDYDAYISHTFGPEGIIK